MTKTLAALAVVAALAAGAPFPAFAQMRSDEGLRSAPGRPDAPAHRATGGRTGEPARYQIERVGEDMLRLDRETGEVQLCAESQPMFACRTVVIGKGAADEAAFPASGELLAENRALKAENEALKQRLAMVKALLEDVEPASADELGALSRPGQRDMASARRDIEEAIDVTDYAFRRFRDLVKSLSEDEDAAR